MQGGVFRTNCIDCLDRTNVTQAKICFKAIESTLEFIREITKGKHRQSFMHTGIQAMGKGNVFAGSASGPIFDEIKDIWAENGDMLSVQYTGTHSNITRVTKQGGQGFIGKMEQMLVGV